MALSDIEKIQNFDKLPDDMIVPLAISRLVRDTSEWTDRRNNPLPVYQLDGQRKGHRVGDIRRYLRGKQLTPAAA